MYNMRIPRPLLLNLLASEEDHSSQCIDAYEHEAAALRQLQRVVDGLVAAEGRKSDGKLCCYLRNQVRISESVNASLNGITRGPTASCIVLRRRLGSINLSVLNSQSSKGTLPYMSHPVGLTTFEAL